jgi:hypothetical protein
MENKNELLVQALELIKIWASGANKVNYEVSPYERYIINALITTLEYSQKTL